MYNLDIAAGLTIPQKLAYNGSTKRQWAYIESKYPAEFKTIKNKGNQGLVELETGEEVARYSFDDPKNVAVNLLLLNVIGARRARGLGSIS